MIKFNPGIQVWSTYKKLIYHINRTKTNHMISVDEEKNIWQNLMQFQIKTLTK